LWMQGGGGEGQGGVLPPVLNAGGGGAFEQEEDEGESARFSLFCFWWSRQCCGFGSARISDFFFLLDPDP
jgi:hypothetical protein